MNILIFWTFSLTTFFFFFFSSFFTLISEKAKKAAKKAKFLRVQVSKSRYEHWMDNIALAQRLKNLYNAPGK